MLTYAREECSCVIQLITLQTLALLFLYSWQMQLHH